MLATMIWPFDWMATPYTLSPPAVITSPEFPNVVSRVPFVLYRANTVAPAGFPDVSAV